jgi:GDPmannose 4,6-dehydratase
MLQQEQAEDFVIATGQQVSVRTFVDTAAAELGVRIDWQGASEQETGTVAEAPAECAMRPGQVIVRVDPRYYRPTEVETLLGDPTKAREHLGWTPTTTFSALVAEMMREDLKGARRDDLVKRHGYGAYDHHE